MLEAELRRLLAFVKSGYTNATHQESEWMQVRGLKLLAAGARGLKLLVCEAVKGVLRAALSGAPLQHHCNTSGARVHVGGLNRALT